MRTESLILLGLFIVGAWNVYLHSMVLLEGRISSLHGWDTADLRSRRMFFLYDLVFALFGSIYLSQYLTGWWRFALLFYATVHCIGHGYYVLAWNTKSELMESVLEWSTLHPAQRPIFISPFWNEFNWWGTALDLGLHGTISILAAGLVILRNTAGC